MSENQKSWPNEPQDGYESPSKLVLSLIAIGLLFFALTVVTFTMGPENLKIDNYYMKLNVRVK